MNSYYKALQAVYQLDAKRQLVRSTNDMINAVRSSVSKKLGYCHSSLLSLDFHGRVSICMLIGCQFIKTDLTAKFSLVLGTTN